MMGAQKVMGKIKEYLVLRRILAIIFHFVGIVGSFWAACMLRFDLQWVPYAKNTFVEYWPWMTAGFFGSVLAFRLYRGLWRFFTLRDCFTTGVAIACGAIAAGLRHF